MDPVVITAIAWILIFIGLVGTLLPGIPGTTFVFGGILLYAVYFGVDTVGMTTLILLGIATALSFVLDVLASLYGASRFGASCSGLSGAVFGGLLGLVLLSLPGLFLGIFSGAVIGEYFLAKKDLNTSLRAGVGSILGLLAGSVLQFVLALVMVGVFVAKVWF